MAFSDEDIKNETRKLFNVGTANYGSIDTYGRRDAKGEGIEPHKAKLRRMLQERQTMSDLPTNRPGREVSLRWEK